MVKKIANIFIWSIVFALILGTIWYTTRDRNRVICANVRVEVIDSTENQFIRGKELEKWVISNNPGIIRKPLSQIDLRKIEEGIRRFKAVEDVWVFSSIVGGVKPGEGSVVVRIRLRDASFRIASPGRDYYIDKLGKPIDWTPNYTPRVMIVTGTVSSDYARKKLLPLISFIKDDPFLSAQIDQISVSSGGKLTMIPRIGEQKIYFGYPDNFEIKFRNLKALYKDGFKRGGWTRYKAINLEFKNQVICIKKS